MHAQSIVRRFIDTHLNLMHAARGQLLCAAVAAAMVYSGGMSFVLLKAIGMITPLRATDDEESVGLDITQHSEEAYLHTSGGSPTSHRMEMAEEPHRLFGTVKSEA